MDLSGLEWVLEQICAETCWALPAHVNRKKDEKWKITLDLFACETAQSLLEIAFLLRNDLRAGVTVSDLEGKQQESVAAVSYTGKRCILVGNE